MRSSMRVHHFLILILFFLIAFNSQAMIVLRTAAQEASEPKFVRIEKEGKTEVSGFCIELMRSLERIDPELRFSGEQNWLPKARIDLGADTGEIDVICGIQKVERNTSRYIYLPNVIFTATFFLIVRTDDKIEIDDWGDIRSLADKGTILTMRNYGINELLDRIGGLSVDATSTSAVSNLKKLEAGRGRFFCHRSPGLKFALRQSGMEHKFRILSKPTIVEKFYFGVSKNLATEKVLQVRDALNTLEKSGELRKIADRYQE